MEVREGCPCGSGLIVSWYKDEKGVDVKVIADWQSGGGEGA